MERIICSRNGRFNARIKCAQIDNSISYYVTACDLCRSERAISNRHLNGLPFRVNISYCTTSVDPTTMMVENVKFLSHAVLYGQCDKSWQHLVPWRWSLAIFGDLLSISKKTYFCIFCS